MRISLKRALAIVAVNVLILTALLASLEIGLRAIYVRSERPPRGLRALFLQYHTRYEREAIQTLPQCTRYDPEVTYTLRPGTCTYSSREFSTTVHVNRAGFRDDENDLALPQIVIVGDSFTMGWGVEHEETYASRLEAELGMPVLNTGISSYGTARELRVIERLRLDSLRVLIVQYHPSDFKENRAYRENGDSLRISSESAFTKAVESENLQKADYRFGRFLYEAQKLVTNGFIGLFKNRFRTDGHHADEFLHVLSTAPIDYDGVTIVVFELNDHARNDPHFVNELADRLASDDLPNGLRTMTVLDLSDRLDETHYYPWDGHLNSEGHVVVANALVEALRLTASF